MGDAALPRHFAVAPTLPLLILKQGHDRSPLVGIGAPQAVGGVGPGRKENRISPRALVHLGRQGIDPIFFRRKKAVKTIGQPIVSPIVKKGHRRKFNPLRHGFDVFFKHQLVEIFARLRAAVSSNLIQRQ